jgi:hypothetical protein
MKSTLLVLLAAILVAPASSTTITIMPASGIADAVTARTNWLAANFDPDYTLNVTESFEFNPYGPYPALLTSIGTFLVMPGFSPTAIKPIASPFSTAPPRRMSADTAPPPAATAGSTATTSRNCSL